MMSPQEIYNYLLDRADSNYGGKSTVIGQLCYGLCIGMETAAELIAMNTPGIIRRKSLHQIYKDEQKAEDMQNEAQYQNEHEHA